MLVDDKQRKSPIFALAIHPDGTRLATGGVDTYIHIWNLKLSAQPRLLSTLTRHTGSILCLRWSPQGQYLASGSDDASIVIWKLEAVQATSHPSAHQYVMPGFMPAQTEHYKAVKRLSAHQSDVNGLAWSPDGRYLASCGMDGGIAIWDIHGLTLLKSLKGHSGHIKGLAWDPLGQFLASHADDKALIIWRIATWTPEVTLQGPFEVSSGATYFQRPR